MAARDKAILLIEDDQNDALLFQRALRASRFDVSLFTVTTIAEAKSYLRGEEKYANRAAYPLPSLIVLDLMLDGRSGLELCDWIRKREQTSIIPITVLGGSGSPAERDDVLRHGANAYHQKPLATEDLQDLVRRLVEFWLGAL
jgi:DNA-binding response OmpR family regulator